MLADLDYAYVIIIRTQLLKQGYLTGNGTPCVCVRYPVCVTEEN